MPGEVESIERSESALEQRSSEEPGSRSDVEDSRFSLEESSTDRGDRAGRAVVVGACEVVVVNTRDPLVLGPQLVEVARAVEAVDVDPPLGDG